MNHLQKSPRSTRRSSTSRRGGFTLIEIMVVLAIATFVAAIVIGGFSEMTAGSKRTSCQTNLTQIYQAARLYAADEGGSFPYYNPTGTTGEKNIGLWALYTFPQANSSARTGNPSDFDTLAPVGSAPIERYLRSAKSLHCPNDQDTDVDHVENLYLDATKTAFNADYLSYQVDRGFGDSALFRSTYSPIRTLDRSGRNPAGVDWNRQLLFFIPNPDTSRPPIQVRRLPDDKTVITWCRWHRGSAGRNDIDPVLFYDGTVQLIPKEQEDPNNPGTFLYGSQRKPKAAP